MSVEYLHLITNHIPIIGLPIAAGILIAGLLLKSPPVQVTGLVVALVASAPIGFIMYTGEAAKERYDANPAAFLLDSGFADPLQEHYDRAETGAKIVYAVIATSALGLVFWMKLKARKIFLWLTLVLALLSIPVNIRIAQPGGEIRRPDFRESQE